MWSWPTCKCHLGNMWKSWNLMGSPTVQGSLIPCFFPSNWVNSPLLRTSHWHSLPSLVLFPVFAASDTFAISEIKGKKMASGRRYPSYPRGKSPENIFCSQGLKELLAILSPQFIINVCATFIASFPSGTDIAASHLGQKSWDLFW